MTVASNLYASKVFSEHPIVSWPLDDEISYISLITEAQRSFANWSEVNNATYSDVVGPEGTPFPDSVCTQITAINPTQVFEAFSANLFNLEDLNQNMNTFAINMYLYTNASVLYYEYGYRYIDPYTAQYIEEVRKVEDSRFATWIRIGGTFNPPNIDSQAQIVFRVVLSEITSPSIIMNGLGIGQWSEQTSDVDLGVVPELIGGEVEDALGPVYGVPVQAYGLSENDGWVLAENNRLLAINHGIPMVYGSDNVTRLSSSETLPSVIFPGFGVLNEAGKYNSYTVEMWMRIENNSAKTRRIWGPISSDYGLYVKRGYLSLVIGNSIGSYFITDWYRPMLVHIIIRENSASVLINGEEVIAITYSTEELDLPLITEDWIGFYCHEDMPIYEIDCVSILPYIIPDAVAKRRFVWGQGVESPETINSAYEGTVAYIDYPYAQYTANQAYPDLSRWDAAYFENVLATRRSLSVPDYNLPTIEIGEKSLQDLYDDNKILNNSEYPSLSATVISAVSSTPSAGYVRYQTSSAHGFSENDIVTISGASISSFNTVGSIISIPTTTTFVIKNDALGSPIFTNGLAERSHPKFISFRPNQTWTDQSYYLFSNLNVITEVVRGIWGVFEIEEETLSPEPLIHFVNTNTGDRFEINIDGNSLTYKLYKGQTVQTFHEEDIEVGDHFTAGIHLPRLFETYGSVVGEFFGNPSALQMYVGGNGTTTFSGYIYRIGFSNQTNLDKIEEHFASDGIAIVLEEDLLTSHLGSYTLIAMEDFNRFFLDIGVSSYWEEYYPLSFFAGYSVDQHGRSNYDLDFLQYNIGYPTTTTIVEDTITGSWTYEELSQEYSVPIIKTYDVLDNSLITGYDDYEDLQNNSETLVDYDFSQSSVRSYVTFQRISSGANKPITDYTISQSLPSTNVLDTEEYQNVFSTKFEIKDQAIIYPPKTFGIKDTAVVLHLDININGIKTNPLNLRKMSFISQKVESNDFKEIGTRFSSKLYPYSKTGYYYNNVGKNPYSITKESVPYLYLTKHSGIESLGLREFSIERGLFFPINTQQAQNQKVSALQIWMKYSEDSFTQVPVNLFAIDGKNINIGFSVITDQSSDRGKLYSVNLETGEDHTALSFYQDGIPVINPYIEKNKWTVIGINFDTPIDFSNYIGSISLFQSAVFNDIAYYKSTSLQQSLSTIYRMWDNVDGVPATPLSWAYWITSKLPYAEWDNVLKVRESGIYGVNPATLFKSYSGTNRQVVDDNSVVTFSEDIAIILASEQKDVDNGVNTPRMQVLNAPEWTSYTRKPV